MFFKHGIALSAALFAFSTLIACSSSVTQGNASQTSPLKLYVTSLRESSSSKSGYKELKIEVVIENNAQYPQGGQGQLDAKVDTAEGFSYDAEEFQLGREIRSWPDFPLVPPSFRRLIGTVTFLVGEKTHPSRVTLKYVDGSDIVSAEIPDKVQQIALPVGDPANLKLEKIGQTHELPAYVMEPTGYGGYKAVTPVSPAPRLVTVESVNYRNSDLVVTLKFENQSVGQNATFFIDAFVLGSKGIQTDGEVIGLDYSTGGWEYMGGRSGALGPGRTDRAEVIFKVPTKENNYLILTSYDLATPPQSPSLKDLWIVDVGK